jgi:hypothetical protein
MLFTDAIVIALRMRIRRDAPKMIVRGERDEQNSASRSGLGLCVDRRLQLAELSN